MTAAWIPDPRHAAHSQLARFHNLMRATHGHAAVGDDYSHLHSWSVRERATFWRELWRVCDVAATASLVTRPALASHSMRVLKRWASTPNRMISVSLAA